MQAGNAFYRKASDLPDRIPVLPLSAALLLPGGRMPLNIFEPRYLELIDAALAGNRLIGLLQPALDGSLRPDGEPNLCATGCMGRITSISESGDGRYVLALQGVCRFRVLEEMETGKPFRICRVAPFVADLDEEKGDGGVDRDALLKCFRAYLEANGLEADWESVSKAENSTLVNALSMMSPYGAAEKQALLDAPDLRTRADTLIAITEMALAKAGDISSSLQ